MKILTLGSIFCLMLFCSIQAEAQTGAVSLNNFVVKENLLKNDKIAIIAADSTDTPIENFSGTFRFSINGFQQDLTFANGVAVAPQPIDKSTFLYLRHQNENGTHGKLFYVHKSGGDLKPYKINWLVLVLVPLAIIILASVFKRFIIIGGILLVVILIFNSRNGLQLGTFFDTIFDGLKNVVG